VFEDRIMGRLSEPYRDKPATGYRKLHKWDPNWMIII
jgi:hypothetical protein